MRMETSEERQFNGLTIKCVIGGSRVPQLENNVLTINGYYKEFDACQIADIYLHEDIIRVSIIEIYTNSFNFTTYYYVYDYGVYNYRLYKDMSVVKTLEKIQPNLIGRNDRHAITFQFGRTRTGMETLAKLMEKIEDQFQTTRENDVFRFREWDNTHEFLIDQKKTKANFFLTTESLCQLVAFLEKEGYAKEAKQLQAYRVKSLVEKVKVTLDFTDYFKKT